MILPVENNLRSALSTNVSSILTQNGEKGKVLQLKRPKVEESLPACCLPSNSNTQAAATPQAALSQLLEGVVNQLKAISEKLTALITMYREGTKASEPQAPPAAQATPTPETPVSEGGSTTAVAPKEDGAKEEFLSKVDDLLQRIKETLVDIFIIRETGSDLAKAIKAGLKKIKQVFKPLSKVASVIFSKTPLGKAGKIFKKVGSILK